MASPYVPNTIQVYRGDHCWFARIDDGDVIVTTGCSARYALMSLVTELMERGYRFDPDWIPPHKAQLVVAPELITKVVRAASDVRPSAN
jgi:hypothetical protein